MSLRLPMVSMVTFGCSWWEHSSQGHRDPEDLSMIWRCQTMTCRDKVWVRVQLMKKTSTLPFLPLTEESPLEQQTWRSIQPTYVCFAFYKPQLQQVNLFWVSCCFTRLPVSRSSWRTWRGVFLVFHAGIPNRTTLMVSFCKVLSLLLALTLTAGIQWPISFQHSWISLNTTLDKTFWTLLVPATFSFHQICLIY